MATKKKAETRSPDDLQNGVKKDVEDRLTDLEERINLIVRCNCLRESER